MGTKPQVRFVAIAGGDTVELFHYRDKGSKGLLITPRYMTDIENSDGTLTPFSQQHSSVHPPNDQGDVAITIKTTLNDGRTIDRVSLVKRGYDRLIWPVYAARLPFPTESIRAMPKAKDKVIQVADYDPALNSLVYTLFVTSKKLDVDKIHADGAQIFKEISELFYLVLFVSFLPIISVYSADITSLTTSSEKRDGVKSEGHLQIESGPLPPEDMMKCHRFFAERLRLKLIDRIAVSRIFSKKLLNEIKVHSAVIMSDPLKLAP